MKDTTLRFDTAFYLVLGISCYWGWSAVSLLTPSLWPQSAEMFSQTCWTINVTSHLAILASIGALKPKHESDKAQSYVLFPSVIIIGTILLALGYSSNSLLVACGGSAISGAGNALAMIVWMRTITLIDEDEHRHFILSGSVILSLLIVLLASSLPMSISLIATTSLPAVMALCLKNAEKIIKSVGFSTLTHSRTDRVDFDNSFDSGDSICDSRRCFLRLTISCFILALPAGLYQNEFSVYSNRPSDWNEIVSCACLLILITTCIDYLLSKRFGTNAFSRLAIPLMAGGLLILALSESTASIWAGVFLQTGYHLSLAYIYTEFGALSLNSRIPNRQIAAFGTCALDMGLLCGFALSKSISTFAYNLSIWAIAAIAYLLLLSGIILVPKIATDLNSSFRRCDRNTAIDGQGKTDDGNETNTVSALAQHYGLSSREEDILTYLLEGRTLRSIADKTFLSYNTVKTHVSHIYQKTGVHTRDELIELSKPNGCVIKPSYVSGDPSKHPNNPMS